MSESWLVNVDQFYNLWSESFYLRLLVDVRSKQAFYAQPQNHASMAIHFDPTAVTLGDFIEAQEEESGLFDKIVFYDQQPYNLSKNLKKIANKIKNGKYHNKQIYILEAGIDAVKKKYEFIWSAKEEEVAYPSLILDDFLYLGDEESSLDDEVIENLGITHVVSLVPDCSARFASQGVIYCHCPLLDVPEASVDPYLPIISRFIRDAISAKKKGKSRVLIHCLAGVSRSPTLVVMYLMQTRKWSLREAYTYVQARRSVIKPNEGFLQSLVKFDENLFGNQSISLAELDSL